MAATTQISQEISDTFTTQLDYIIKEHRESYYKSRMELDSQAAAHGRFQSGRTVINRIELVKSNFNTTIDETLKFTLEYASEEGISHIDLIKLAEEKLHSYRQELVADIDTLSTQVNLPKTSPQVGQAKEELNALVVDKAKVALTGWVNKQRIYTGNRLSPSLGFFNSLCFAYDDLLKSKAPKIKERFEAAYKSLESDNASHWANAVHECRKIFEDLADLVFPAKTTPEIREGKEIQVGHEQFKNRITCYVESQSDSKSYEKVVTTQLKDLYEKLDALVNTTQKASHAGMTREDATMYIAQIYLLAGSILSL